MMKLYLFDQAGQCYMRIDPPIGVDLGELARRNDAATYVLSEHVIDISAARIVDGELAEVPPPPRVMEYHERRHLDYPPLGEQLDALWHAMQDGLLPQIPGFYDRIAAVKAAHPKPQE